MNFNLRNRTCAALGLATLLAIAPTGVSAAADDVVLADMKCIVASGDLPEGTSKEDEDALMTMGIFYAGKIYGRDPAFDMDGYIKAHSMQLDSIDRPTEILRCADELERRGTQMSAITGGV